MIRLIDGQIYNITFQDSLTRAVEFAIIHTANPMPLISFKRVLAGNKVSGVLLLDTDDDFEVLVETKSGTFILPSVAVKKIENV